jgi:hypothetical protein
MVEDLLKQRELERLQFLDVIKRFMLGHAEESNSQTGRIKAQIGWLISIADLFTTIEQLPSIKSTTAAGEYEVEITIFRTRIMTDIMGFARTEEEAFLIVSEIFTWVTSSLALKVQMPYQVQLANNPEKIVQPRKVTA